MRGGKFAIMAALFGAASACAPVTEQEPVQSGQAPAIKQTGDAVHNFTVYFDTNSSKIDDKGAAVLASALKKAELGWFTDVRLSGHTDLAGSASYNEELAKNRVEAVAEALVNAGVAPSKIGTSILGEEQPQVVTSDGKAEAINRRVEIELMLAGKSLDLKQMTTTTGPEPCSSVLLFLSGAQLQPCVVPTKQQGTE